MRTEERAEARAETGPEAETELGHRQAEQHTRAETDAETEARLDKTGRGTTDWARPRQTTPGQDKSMLEKGKPGQEKTEFCRFECQKDHFSRYFRKLPNLLYF